MSSVTNEDDHGNAKIRSGETELSGSADFAIADITADDVAHILATSVPVARRLMRTQSVKSFKAGGQWRTSRGAVADYIMAQLEKAGGRGKPSSSL